MSSTDENDVVEPTSLGKNRPVRCMTCAGEFQRDIACVFVGLGYHES